MDITIKRNAQREERYQRLLLWLESKYAKPKDVLHDDESGRDYILLEIENGTAGEEGYSFYFEPLFLPNEFQNLI